MVAVDAAVVVAVPTNSVNDRTAVDDNYGVNNRNQTPRRTDNAAPVTFIVEHWWPFDLWTTAPPVVSKSF